MNVLYTPAVEAALTDLRSTDAATAERIETAIDVLENDPSNANNRRHSIRTANGRTIWAIPVRGRDDSWIILWSGTTPDTAVVLYVGLNFLNA